MLQELIKKIASLFHPKKIILFGSNAWGGASENSDFDLLIIMESNEKRPSKRAIEILRQCHPGNISIDLLVRTPIEIEERINFGDPFIKKIISKGKILYAEPGT